MDRFVIAYRDISSQCQWSGGFATLATLLP